MNYLSNEKLTNALELIKEKYFIDEEILESVESDVEVESSLIVLGEKKIILFDVINGNRFKKLDEIAVDALKRVMLKELKSSNLIELVSKNSKLKIFLDKEGLNKLKSYIEKHTNASVENRQVSWYNRIPGFRSQTTWKMLVSGFVYLMIFVGCVNSFSGDDKQIAEEKKEDVEEVVAETEEDTEEIEEEVEEKPEPEPKKEELYVELDSIEYDKEKDLVYIVLDTNLPNDTEVYVGMEEVNDEAYFNPVPNSEKVKDGVVNVTIGDFDDDELGVEMLQNGDYKVTASYSMHEENERNIHLLDELGDYDELVENYDVVGDLEKTEQGYVVNDISLGNFEISEAATLEDVENNIAEQNKKNAKTIDYKELDKNADKYAFEYVTYSGEIIQIMEGSGITQIRLDIGGGDILFIEYEDYTDFVEGDNITIYGEIYGNFSYESQAGWTITVPGIIADYIE